MGESPTTLKDEIEATQGVRENLEYDDIELCARRRLCGGRSKGLEQMYAARAAEGAAAGNGASARETAPPRMPPTRR